MKTIDVNNLKKLLDKKEVVLIDVRELGEYNAGCIDGSCLIPLGEISQDKLPSKSKPIVIHCRSGKRSADACHKLLQQNPNLDLYSLEGGIIAWEQAGLEVITPESKKKIVSLENQTKLVAGLLVFCGTVAGAYINSGFYLIPGFVGLGLMFAGSTGHCMMTQLLAKMPWNK